MKLIKLSDTHYIIVDDSEIKEDWVVDTNDADFIFKITSEYIKDNRHYDWGKYKVKITHSTQPLEQYYSATDGTIPFVYHKIKPLSLSGIEEAINGYSVQKLSYEKYNDGSISTNTRNDWRECWKEGFKAHQELVKDKDKEVIQLLTNITEWSSFKEHPIGKQAQRALDLLLPKTEWDIEFIDNKIKLI